MDQKPEDGTPFAWRGENVTIHPFTLLIGRDKIALGDDTIVDSFVLMNARNWFSIGKHCHVATGAKILGGGCFEMGDYSGLSINCVALCGSDDFTDGGLTGPTIPEEYRNCDRSGVFIGKHAVVGANSVLLPGSVIEEGATIGANSVVRGTVPAWTVWAGSIAKQIGIRDRDKYMFNLEVFEANRK